MWTGAEKWRASIERAQSGTQLTLCSSRLPGPRYRLPLYSTSDAMFSPHLICFDTNTSPMPASSRILPFPLALAALLAPLCGLRLR